MGDEVTAERAIDGGIGGPLLRSGAVGNERVDVVAVLGLAARDSGVDDVDDAADRRRTEQQCGRPAKHLDPLRRQWVDGRGVIRAG
jgi:hypothetical protein